MGFKEIGRKIQLAREEKGLTQAELAQELGMTQAGLSNYELGKRRLYLNQIERIARVLGKDIAFFIGGANHESAASDESSHLMKTVAERLRNLDEDDLRSINDYLDFLAWRKRRDRH
ncbi:MAG TPA: helix-turn-helix transcriptional regulator [Deltaproteobacteria bacterium]|nr:helix-turn-helix transcriptional regulator [Deltaproteobacteria bacterium]HOM28021.1 helix-turn-helix transcriptional regulator [Deltaproteobacteria bacterium]HPP80139.1 helix-turn-helix transcriptional regulator [Deltaproteobacteria bacterium]